MNQKPNPTAKRIQPAKHKQPEPKTVNRTVRYDGGDERTARVVDNKPKDGFFKQPSEGRVPLNGKKLVKHKTRREMRTASDLLRIILWLNPAGVDQTKRRGILTVEGVGAPSYRQTLQLLQTLNEIGSDVHIVVDYSETGRTLHIAEHLCSDGLLSGSPYGGSHNE